MGGCRCSGVLVVQEKEIDREENANGEKQRAFY